MMSKGIKQMEGNLEKLKAELKNHQKPQDKHDKFAAKIQDFLTQAEARFKKLEDQFQFMEKKFEDLASYYCFDRKKVTMEEFFGDIMMFCKDFDVSWTDVVSVLGFIHFLGGGCTGFPIVTPLSTLLTLLCVVYTLYYYPSPPPNVVS